MKTPYKEVLQRIARELIHIDNEDLTQAEKKILVHLACAYVVETGDTESGYKLA